MSNGILLEGKAFIHAQVGIGPMQFRDKIVVGVGGGSLLVHISCRTNNIILNAFILHRRFKNCIREVTGLLKTTI